MRLRILNTIGYLAFLSPLLTAVYVAAAPHPRRAPGAPMPVQVPVTGQAMGADGRQYQISGVVTLTVGEAPVPIPTPTPTPVPGPGVMITTVVDATGAMTPAEPGGSLVWIKGSGFGSGGLIKVAGQACAVVDWAPWAVEVKLPVVFTSQTGPVVVAPTGVNPATSAFAFTIIGAPGPNPLPTPTPIPTPTPNPQRTMFEYPPHSGRLHYEGHLHPGLAGRTYGPLGTWSYPSATGLYPEAFAPPYMVEPPLGKPLTGRFPVAPVGASR